MPLFTTELNRLADSIGASTLTIRLHTAIPSNASPTNGRLAAGGGTFETGQAAECRRYLGRFQRRHHKQRRHHIWDHFRGGRNGGLVERLSR